MTDETWTEVVVKVGNDHMWHLEVSPDGEGCGGIEIRYMESGGVGPAFKENARVMFPVALVPRLIKALETVAQNVRENPL